jgi:hypothetical protein
VTLPNKLANLHTYVTKKLYLLFSIFSIYTIRQIELILFFVCRAVQNLVSDPTNSLISVGLCKYPFNFQTYFFIHMATTMYSYYNNEIIFATRRNVCRQIDVVTFEATSRVACIQCRNIVIFF